MALFHITTHAAWTAACAAGEYRPPSLEREGFIHLSTEEQVVATARRCYRGRSGLVVLRCDVDDVRWEDTPDGRFPHLYRALLRPEVGAVLELVIGDDGNFVALSSR